MSESDINEFDLEQMDILFLVAYPAAPPNLRPQRPSFICFGEVTPKQSLEAVAFLQRHGLSSHVDKVREAALRYLTYLKEAPPEKLGEEVQEAAKKALSAFCGENTGNENRIWCPGG